MGCRRMATGAGRTGEPVRRGRNRTAPSRRWKALKRSGGGIRTHDLRVMSPTSYRCSTPRWVGGRRRPIVPPPAGAVSSALGRCTAVFGMGTGGAAPLGSPPEPMGVHRGGARRGGAGGGARHAAPSGLSTASLRPLPALHGRPIHQVISLGPYSLRMGDLILGGASHLDAVSAYRHRTAATQRCPGRDNWATGGPSAPVLSY